MVVNVSDVRSNPNDQVAHAVKVIGKSKDRATVFKAIYYGKKKVKTVEEIHKAIGLSRKRVLEEAKKLVNNDIVHQTNKGGDTAYKKDSFYTARKVEILALVRNPQKFSKLPTKATPRPIGTITEVIRIPQQYVHTKMITIDEIDSFSKVRKQRGTNKNFILILESEFKEGIKQILNEHGCFRDWGGERNDLLTTRLRLKGKRRATAFAFKGRGTHGKLTPASMGKNGDQIQRLFRSPAEVFLIQYCGQIDDSVLDQMEAFAKIKSIYEKKEIFYGIIDGQDTRRIIEAYPNAFPNQRQKYAMK